MRLSYAADLKLSAEPGVISDLSLSGSMGSNSSRLFDHTEVASF